MQLLATLLEYNPYNSTLDLHVNEQRSNQSEAELREMSPPPAPVPVPTENAVEGEENEGDEPRGNSGQAQKRDNTYFARGWLCGKNVDGDGR